MYVKDLGNRECLSIYAGIMEHEDIPKEDFEKEL